jgi:hypothetical protein
MTSAANAFLASLGPEQKQKAQFAVDAAERTHWHFIPTEMFARNGLTLKEMSATQRDAAHALLKSGLSQHGYTTATTIMSLENILRVVGRAVSLRAIPSGTSFRCSARPLPAARGGGAWRGTTSPSSSPSSRGL